MFITLEIVSTEYYRLKNYINKLVNNRVRAVVKKFAGTVFVFERVLPEIAWVGICLNISFVPALHTSVCSYLCIYLK